MSDQQAYRTTGQPTDGNDEWNRMHAAIRSVTNQMATMTLVKVLSVSGRMVSIQPIVAQLDGSGNAVPHGTINNVPVWRYQAGGVAVVVDPVVGDIGLAVFAHSDISAAKTNKAASAPGSRRRFDWADAVYIGGLFGNDEPNTRITLSASGVDITSNQAVTINAPSGTTVNGPLTAANGLTVTGGATIDGKAFATHKHNGVTAGTGVSGVVN